MEWIADPKATGAWLRRRLEADRESHIQVVPPGFAAYARVFHPPSVHWLSGALMPHDEQSLTVEERSDLAQRMRSSTTTWAETASAFGATMHPLAQWPGLVGAREGEDWAERVGGDGRAYGYPEEGSLDPDLFAVLARHLLGHTGTPRDGVVCLWDGFGGLLGHDGPGPSRSFLVFSEDPAQAAPTPRPQRWQGHGWWPGILSDEISRGPRLHLPGRDYVAFRADLGVFTDPGWILDVPWRDLESEGHGFEPTAQHPNLVWPEDRAWVLVSEIDFPFTVVAGPAELIAEICADPTLESAAIPAGADLTLAGDSINRWRG